MATLRQVPARRGPAGASNPWWARPWLGQPTPSARAIHRTGLHLGPPGDPPGRSRATGSSTRRSRRPTLARSRSRPSGQGVRVPVG